MSSFGYTAAFAIMVSLLVSFTLTPMLCSRFLRLTSTEHSSKDTWLYHVTDRPYRKMLEWSMSHRWVIVALAVAVTFSSAPISKMIGYDFLPSDDQSLFEVLIKNPPGSSVEGTQEMIERAEAEIRKLPGIKDIVTTVGADIQRQVDRGSLIVEMVPPGERKGYDQLKVMAMARERLPRIFPREVTVTVQLPALIQGAQNSELIFYVQGPDLRRLERYSGEIVQMLRGMGGVTDIDTNFVPGKPEVDVVINRDKAADLNVNVAQIANAVRTLVGGDQQATTYREGDDRYDVMLRVDPAFRRSQAGLERLFVPSSSIGNVPLSNVASLVEATGPTQINRYNRNRQVAILANIDESQGQSLSAVLAAVNKKVDEMNLPPEYRTGLIGASKEFGRAAQNFIFAFILSIVLMYMILAAQFESFIDPVTILLSLPLSVPFALLSLMVARENFSIIYSSVGILVLFGIVKKNSILQIDHIKSLRREGVPRLEAILRGCEDRLRPILMTTMALVAGMIPLALGGGAGAGSRRTVAIVVIGGQTLCLLLTLLVTPVFYSLFDDLAHSPLWGRIGAFFSMGGAMLKRAPGFRSFLSFFMIAALVAPAWSQQPPSSLETAAARVGVGAEERKLTLRDAIEMALQNNLEVEIERNTLASAEQAVRVAKGVFDGIFRWTPQGEYRSTPTPNVLVGAGGKLRDDFHIQNFTYSRTLSQYGTTFQPFFENQWTQTSNPFVGLNPGTTSRLGLSFTQPLMRGFRTDPQRTEIKLRSKNVEIAKSDFELRVIDVTARVEQVYWDLVAARQDVGVRADFVEWGREQLARTQRQIEAGTLAKVEFSAAEAELDRRLDSYYAAVGLVTEVENALKQLLSGGRDNPIWNAAIVPVDDKPETMAILPEVQEAIRQALTQRVELRQNSLRKDNAETQRELSLNQMKPLVNLQVQYVSSGLGGALNASPNPFSQEELYRRINQLSAGAGLPPIAPPQFGGIPDSLVGGYGTTLSNVFRGRFQGVAGGLQIEWNPRNTAARANLESAVLSAKRLDLERSRIEQAIAVQVRNSLQNIQTAKQRIAAAEASARAAKEKLDSEIRLFQTGESTNFLVLTRQNEFTDSRRRVVVANLDLNKALAQLRVAMGGTLSHYRIQPK
jgi:HAE1 family hydrophobic/amphiphilic exporter-1